MCGRYASARKRQDLLEEFRIDRDRVIDDLEPDYNVAPTKAVYAVLNRGERGREKQSAGAGETQRGSGEDGSGDEAAQEVARELRAVRWGLVPFWAKDPAIGSRLINARVETVDAKPSFRNAFAKRRCLLPADGFYEWLKVEDSPGPAAPGSVSSGPAAPPRGKIRKQPYYIHRADGGVLAFAGLYELWRDKSVPDDHPQAWLWTTVIITTQAEDEVGRLHDRMPMVIDPARWGEWLDHANNDAPYVHSLLAPAAVSGLASYPVGTDVNYVRNNGPGLITPLSSEGGAGRGGGRADSGPRSGPNGGQPAALATDRPARTEDRYRYSGSAPLSLF
jgi:putative SOS response-associated peptidase YedK